ncbi:MAG: cytochrome c-type biogenesis protein [Devosia sp.]
MRALLAIALMLLLAVPAVAVRPDELLADPTMETRARAISAQLRCLVCQNQSIDDSDAALARDLRLLVRERLVAGDSDTEVREFIVARYGEYVLLNPVIAPHTVLLWIAGPLVLLIGAGAVALAARRKRVSASDVPLTEDEAKALEELR